MSGQWKTTAVAVWLVLGAGSAAAAEFRVDVTVPALAVAEYHRPYVAVWVETEKGRHQQNLALWYDQELKDNEGTKWLKDLRLWWRRSGRSLEFPVDGLSGATRPVGTHTLSFAADSPQLATLPAGNYQLVVEAVREVGGREVLRLPFSWPASTQQQALQGQHELGSVTLNITP
ncbi:MAG: DUF2271 domain-containing protein [Oceanospirillales bacterium]|uniref:DUF2271 domain-containing protein n=1 Tax=Marinobacterium halophilum TaxID=267374 RepID=A0A2P8EYX3_9GAMM|nr:DUF2271 domain-containing protein [Marinobacterium halophilum]MBR9830201.1 DUF2271 domain-containing protein [Oceanospirillales bacterium]PSL14645.1 hypothetical protein CLV44_10796 [Marinobacterium halophilum]